MTEIDEDVLHICLAETRMSNDLSLIQTLKGGLTQEQIASAFKEGAKDYFSDPYDVKLLAERVNALGARRNRIE